MCDHNHFYVDAKVAKRTDGEGGPVIGFSADIRIICLDCRKAFEFIGMPGGSSPMQPMVSADSLEARLPIKPHSTII